MHRKRYVQVDVFTDRAGYGNALGVVVDADGMDTDAMQRFAAWTNLSETTFLLGPTDASADYRVCIFTPRRELPFAGHPSVGSAFVALDLGLVHARDGTLVQECAAGLLPVRVETVGARRRVHVRAPDASMRHASTLEYAALAQIFPALPHERMAAVHMVDNGPLWWTVRFATALEVRALVPDLEHMAQLCRASGCVGLAVYAHADAEDHELVVRAFCPNDSIPEDPVTGSVNAAIGAVLVVDGGIARTGNPYRASQGRELGRDGVVHVQVADSAVWIGGDSVIVIRGEVEWR